MSQRVTVVIGVLLLGGAILLLQETGILPSTQQYATIVNDGPYPNPPTKAYCNIHKDKLADVYDYFISNNRSALGNNSFNDRWINQNSVEGGRLLLRNFGYSGPNTSNKYSYGGTATLSDKVDGCYCKVLEEGPIPPALQNGFWERARMRTLGRVPQSQLACCQAVDSNGVLRGELYDKLDSTKKCCDSGKVVPRCSGSGSCPSSVAGIPNITFETLRTSDNCCTSSSLGATTTAFLQELGEYCSAKVTAAKNACHSFGSDHYGGCGVDLTGVSQSCLKKAGMSIDGSYSPGTCVWEDNHYHCTLCNSNGPGTPGYDRDGTY